jgi:hypothetical protein
VRDIYELIRQREADVERFEKEIERAHTELDALRLAAKLLDENAETPRPVAVTAAAASFGTTPVRPTTPAPTPTPWASAKQFP